jgi:hypothetical protein
MKASVKTRQKQTALPDEDKIPKKSPFDFVKAINEKKLGDIDDDMIQRCYDAFLTNRSFSNTPDTLFLANEMNLLNNLDKVMQFAFYYHAVDRKPNRYGTWNKLAAGDDSLKLVMEYYGYSRRRAEEVLPLLSTQMKRIQEELSKGGLNGKSRCG